MLWFILFLATIPLANWLVVTFGVIPVGFGLAAPAGALLIGPAFILRDLVQERLGWVWALSAILMGAALSVLVSTPALAAASLAAFVLSEGLDMAVYTPLRRRGFLMAVVVSSIAGIVLDSVVFLHLAFGSQEYLAGQILAKGYAMLAVMALVAMRQKSYAG